MQTFLSALAAFAAFRAAEALIVSRNDPSKDRLSTDCKEPSGSEYETYSGAFGPEKIFCCETAKHVLADVEERCGQECTDAHPCTASLKKLCPAAIEEYKAKQEKACKPRPENCGDHTAEDSSAEKCAAHGDGETCEWYEDKCQEKPKKCGDHSEGSSEERCVAHGDGNTCEWYEEKCQEKPKKCADHSEEERCVAHGDGKTCGWYEEKCKDKAEKCADHTAEEPCVAHGDGKSCEWAEDKCGEKPPTCPDHTEEEPCLAHGDGSTCKWDGKACQKDSLAWCYKMCGEIAQPTDACKNKDACKQFCTEAAEKFSAKK